MKVKRSMKFAIRDDDTCYFTNPDELVHAYDFMNKGTVSLYPTGNGEKNQLCQEGKSNDCYAIVMKNVVAE